ncbi:AraC family transcriptional regulator [Mesorhizobium sp. M0904]|uniref:AraC family transcriptional regulator n=1 Tax=Mesorhizobium sp. M0904 TaxID=2957022 RepID=UPI00333B3D65
MNAPAKVNAERSIAFAEHAAAFHNRFELAVPVLPGFSHLALLAYIEPFRIANTVLRLPLFRWRIVGLNSRPVEGARGLAISVEATVDELASSSEDRKIRQLVVVAGEPIEGQLTPQLSGFRLMARRGVSMCAVGTATWLFAQTGLLSGTRCTIHWSRLAAFSEVFRKPAIRETLFVKDGQYSTCAGELAAFDLAVDLIADHAGGAIAQEVCRHAIVDGQRPRSNRQTAPSGISYSNVSHTLTSATWSANSDVLYRTFDEPGTRRRTAVIECTPSLGGDVKRASKRHCCNQRSPRG